ncbi:MAG: hypothetical protein Q8P67_12690 [archaeon]|nr:hypothetical protein [archaeon]
MIGCFIIFQQNGDGLRYLLRGVEKQKRNSIDMRTEKSTKKKGGGDEKGWEKNQKGEVREREREKKVFFKP